MLFTMNETIHLHILASGSKGNACLVEGPQGYVLVDCGISRRELMRRAEELGIGMGRVKALLLTHEHSDHVGGVTVFCKHFEGGLYATAGTVASRRYLVNLPFSLIAPGDELELAGMQVQVFRTSHDVADPVGFAFSCNGDRVGYCTDTGVLTSQARTALRGCRVLALESNHDVAMLRHGPYPEFLQQRILGPGGHLSNAQAAEALAELVTEDTQTVVAMHISEKNNTPELAMAALIASVDDRVTVLAASQTEPMTVW